MPIIRYIDVILWDVQLVHVCHFSMTTFVACTMHMMVSFLDDKAYYFFIVSNTRIATQSIYYYYVHVRSFFFMELWTPFRDWLILLHSYYFSDRLNGRNKCPSSFIWKLVIDIVETLIYVGKCSSFFYDNTDTDI